MEARTIAIIGGGFAGTTLARALEGKLPQGYELLLINEESHTTFTPMLPEAVGAAVFRQSSLRSGKWSGVRALSWGASRKSISRHKGSIAKRLPAHAHLRTSTSS